MDSDRTDTNKSIAAIYKEVMALTGLLHDYMNVCIAQLTTVKNVYIINKLVTQMYVYSLETAAQLLQYSLTKRMSPCLQMGSL